MLPQIPPPLLPSIPKKAAGQMSHLAAATGPAAILLLFAGTILFSAPWTVIQAGRTLFLAPEFKAAISLVADEKESGPALTGLLF